VSWLARAGDDVRVTVRVQPRASRTEIAGELGDALKIRLCAPPVEGAANRELVAFLSKRVGRPKSAISIERGERGRLKIVRIGGIGLDDARVRLNPP
jgi:uncharacterized protein (TIGR00251 family)